MHSTQAKTGGSVPLPRVGGALSAHCPQYETTAASVSNATPGCSLIILVGCKAREGLLLRIAKQTSGSVSR